MKNISVDELQACKAQGFVWVIFDGDETIYCTDKPGLNDIHLADRPEALKIDDILESFQRCKEER